MLASFSLLRKAIFFCFLVRSPIRKSFPKQEVQSVPLFLKIGKALLKPFPFLEIQSFLCSCSGNLIKNILPCTIFYTSSNILFKKECSTQPDQFIIIFPIAGGSENLKVIDTISFKDGAVLVNGNPNNSKQIIWKTNTKLVSHCRKNIKICFSQCRKININFFFRSEKSEMLMVTLATALTGFLLHCEYRAPPGPGEI